MTISVHERKTAHRSARQSPGPVRVGDVMREPIATIGPDRTYLEVVNLMLTINKGGLPVVDDDGRLLGVVTTTDLLPDEASAAGRNGGRLGLLADRLLGRDAEWLSRDAYRVIAEVMHRDVVTVSPDTPLAEAAELMWTSDHRHLPVVRDGVLVGVIGDRDLVQDDVRWDA